MSDNCINCKNRDSWIKTNYSSTTAKAECMWSYPDLPVCIDIFELPKRYDVYTELDYLGSSDGTCYMINSTGCKIPVVDCKCYQTRS